MAQPKVFLLICFALLFSFHLFNLDADPSPLSYYPDSIDEETRACKRLLLKNHGCAPLMRTPDFFASQEAQVIGSDLTA